MARHSDHNLGRGYLMAFLGFPMLAFGVGSLVSIAKNHYLPNSFNLGLAQASLLVAGLVVGGKYLTTKIGIDRLFPVVLGLIPVACGYATGAVVGTEYAKILSAGTVVSGGAIMAYDLLK
ncbi:hypothetical protein PPL_02937 [Heterostelium album PN500]|uniref:Uncharacterized protein n=1 Tax=Heterostelium pallidum (strain ATCC 26659 / Pp 5 / PN500) TaxID=670386 RepID=D3B3G9_HETP5|nr:hypothetical protein PPL_02937 [Heterostelium album PN500]EFA83867.1 hypothetical protein PPL_02937 [Heterostelium album PN500]|eukprot:XP_020435984.1 hypothetical protein PPL_02937 [Heterostelium album PN500]